jgi:hypothetical protein
VIAATPEASDAEPIGLPLPEKVTDPNGVWPPVEVTAAVRVIAVPKTEGFAEEVSAVAVPVEETVWLSVLLLPANAAPEGVNSALMLCTPVASDDVLKVAAPLVTVTGEPSDVAPSENCTLPAGAPSPGDVTEIVAVNVTPLPASDGLLDAPSVSDVAAAFTAWDKVLLPDA